MTVGIDDRDRKDISIEMISKDEENRIEDTSIDAELPQETDRQPPAHKKSTHVEQATQQQKPKIQGTFAEKTDRLQAWVQFIRAVAPFIWAIVILIVIIPLVGQLFIANAFSNKTVTTQTNPPVTVVKEHTVDWSKVNEAMKLTLDNAYKSAEDYASEELDVWVNELMSRVDSSFLDWYFGYFNQKQLEYKSLFVQLSAGAAHLLNPKSPTPE